MHYLDLLLKFLEKKTIEWKVDMPLLKTIFLYF